MQDIRDTQGIQSELNNVYLKTCRTAAKLSLALSLRQPPECRAAETELRRWMVYLFSLAEICKELDPQVKKKFSTWEKTSTYRASESYFRYTLRIHEMLKEEIVKRDLVKIG